MLIQSGKSPPTPSLLSAHAWEQECSRSTTPTRTRRTLTTRTRGETSVQRRGSWQSSARLPSWSPSLAFLHDHFLHFKAGMPTKLAENRLSKVTLLAEFPVVVVVQQDVNIMHSQRGRVLTHLSVPPSGGRIEGRDDE